jgi:hypothetical protein
MIIRKITEEDLQGLINYNIKTYPDRDKIEESFNYRFYSNPFSKGTTNESLLVSDPENNIIGQALMMHSKLGLKGQEYPIVWGMDFFVDKSFRGLTGTLLLKKAIEVGNHFGVGLSDTALELHLHFGEHIAGYLYKYFRLTSIRGLLKTPFTNKADKTRSYKFPEELKIKGGKFVRVHDPAEIASEDGYWNAELAEFVRNEEFINWRFFRNKDEYVVYKYLSARGPDDSKPVYFAVHPIFWRKLNCLLLTDYRFTSHRKDMFEKILNAAAKLARKNKIAVTFTGCSLPQLGNTMRRNLYVRLGKKMVIITNFQYLKRDPDLQKDSILVTYADSDIDFNFFSNQW